MKIPAATQLIKNAKHALALTGAGVSKDSGIPTFRGEGGLWDKYDPQKVASFSGFKADPLQFWDFLRDLLEPKRASPNRGHEALSFMEKAGFLQAVITQNIDGLHQAAGSKRVFELHGSLNRLHCVRCFWEEQVARQIFSPEQAYPCCPQCGSNLVKPQIILFGEPLPITVFDEVKAEVAQCDLFIVIGSSLEVFPAASLPRLAKRNGAQLLLINQEEISYGPPFDLAILGKAEDILPAIIREMEK